ncbi:hypothetical protein B0A48_18677 [Cryoendolithus antarcticus]|uniref:DUF1330 domain-containing protein n=1 Tax=Cryoendolithus antarcticus TaxID=1507870 RepID=A0A1V8S7K3_9PEZI|nr:hypothetical protein B0A48_18677 [Cryoendolithus antarcticus]
MPLITVHLLKLSTGVTPAAFVQAISTVSAPLVASRVVRWIITPGTLSKDRLLNTAWDLLVIVPLSAPIQAEYLRKDRVTEQWSITAGAPKSLVNGFHERNERLLRPQTGDVPRLTGSLDKPRMAGSTQGLELTNDLLQWSKDFKLGQDGAVSMLNLLAFKPGKAAHDSYLRYGKAFAESIGASRGGNAKIVGKVVPSQGTTGEDSSGWDEVALAHYPSIRHFTDMLASEDYQIVNHRDRLPSLRDTCILCTTELDPDLQQARARL